MFPYIWNYCFKIISVACTFIANLGSLYQSFFLMESLPIHQSYISFHFFTMSNLPVRWLMTCSLVWFKEMHQIRFIYRQLRPFFSLHLRNNLYANSIGEFAWARSLMWFNAYLWQGWFCIICFFSYVGIITPFFFLHTIHFIKLRKIYILCTLKQVELSHPNAELRLLEVFYHKIYKVINLQLKLVWLMGILVRWWF